MGESLTLLKAILRSQHMQEHRSFCRAYDKAAKRIDPTLVGHYPSKATFYRWLAGGCAKLPHPNHCRVLEAMFPGLTAHDLMGDWDDRRPLPEIRTDLQVPPTVSQPGPTNRATYADLTAAFASRAEFAEHMPPHTLFDEASTIQAAGLSLNLLCQQYSDQRLRKILTRGVALQALFLDPVGAATKSREIEEGHGPGDLASLTRLNMQMLRRLREELPMEERGRVELRTYDEPLRFNMIIIDGRRCVAQPYMPAARGVDSPTLVMSRKVDGTGMFWTFETVFRTLWESGAVCE